MRFLVGYTATPAGADALALGVRLARAPGAELDVVLVLNGGERATLTPTDPGYDRLLLDTAEGWLEEARALVPVGISVHTHLEHADSFTQGLLAAAARLQANLIVVGAATHGLLGRFAIGSVAGGLLHSSPMPSTLKAWVDYIHLPAVTAPFDDPASQQPLAGRPAVLVSTRGGVYDPGTSTEFDDHALPALTLILANALGMTVETIVATRTLSERCGAPAAEVAKQHEELAAAHESATQAARRLG